MSRLKFEESDEDDIILYYDNDPELPIFSTINHGYQASVLARILMDKNIDLSRVCHIQPFGIAQSATFIVDLDDVMFSDLKADDLGAWTTNGTKSIYFSMLGGDIQIASGKPSHSSYFILTRRYYTHGTYSLLRRILSDVRGNYPVTIAAECGYGPVINMGRGQDCVAIVISSTNEIPQFKHL